jgi:hypothetical protein
MSNVMIYIVNTSMANTYQRNKQNFICRNGCAKEISKKIKDKKKKKGTYKGNNGSEREARHYRHNSEEKGSSGMATLKGCKRRDYQN